MEHSILPVATIFTIWCTSANEHYISECREDTDVASVKSPAFWSCLDLPPSTAILAVRSQEIHFSAAGRRLDEAEEGQASGNHSD